MIWTTKTIEHWLDDHVAAERDFKIMSLLSPDLGEWDPTPPVVGGMRNAYIVLQMTNEEMEENIKFIKGGYRDTLMSIITGQDKTSRFNGTVSANTYKNETMDRIWKTVGDNRFNLLLVSRAVDMRMVSSIEMIGHAMKREEIVCQYVAHTKESAEYTIYLIAELIRRLPYHLQPGIRNIFKYGIDFANGSKIIASEKDACQGFTTNFLSIEMHSEKVMSNFTTTLMAQRNSRVIAWDTPSDKNDFFSKIEGSDTLYHTDIFPMESEEHIAMIGRVAYAKEYLCLRPGTPEYRDFVLDEILD